MEFLDRIHEALSGIGLSERGAALVLEIVAAAAVALLAWLANLVAKGIIIRAVRRIVLRTKTDWDDVLLRRKVFTRLSHFAPALVIWWLAPQVLGPDSQLVAIARSAAEIYMIVIGLLVASAFLDSADEILRRFTTAMRLPTRVYVQVAKLLLSIAAAVFALSITLDKSPWVFLSGVGALTAVILLIFKDSILGLVAGIQLTANDMVRPGDWIEMPKYGADGDVMEISLTTVKVRNWDKTISTIPTYALVSDSFRNWRGMQESGGRRIKRSVFIDVNTIRFCTPAMIEKFSRIGHLEDYVARKQRELSEYNASRNVDDSSPVNGRHMTNVGTFRAYLVQYLRHHPKIRQDMTFLIRHLQPTDKGLPIEIYVFSNDSRWAQYEEIQADIFDHVFAALPEFGLRAFQSPSGADIREAVARRAG